MKIESLKLWCESEFVRDYHTAKYGYIGLITGFFEDDEVKINKDFDNDLEVMEVINFLKSQSGEYLLQSLKSLENYCYTHFHDHIPYQFGCECLGFRIIGEHIAWYIFCTPWNERTSFFIHAFDKNILFETLAKERNLVKCCSSICPFTGERIKIYFGIGILKYPQYGCNLAKNKSYTAKYNREYGVNINQLRAMEYGALFGWEKPLARAEKYDKNGKIKVE